MILKEKILILIILILLINNNTNCQPTNDIDNNNNDDNEKFLSKLKLLDYLSKNLNSNEESNSDKETS
jgi:hypothetical protein